MAKKPDQTVTIGFAMADPEGTAPMRVVAGHAQRVGEMWQQLAEEMFKLADSFDRLSTAPAEDEPNSDQTRAKEVERERGGSDA